MPSNLVKSEADEKLWSKAKATARKQYPNISEDSARFWKIVTSIYKKMKGVTTKGSIVNE